MGADIIADLDANADRIEIQTSLFVTVPASADEMFAIYGSIGNGYLLLDFGAEGSITLQGLSAFSGLADVFSFT